MTHAIILVALATSWADITTINLTDRDGKAYDGVTVRVVASEGRAPAFSLKTEARAGGKYVVEGIPQVDEKIFVRIDHGTNPVQTTYVPVFRKNYTQWPPADIAISIVRGEFAHLLPPQNLWLGAADCRYAGVETVEWGADGTAIRRRALWHLPPRRVVLETRVYQPSYYQCWPSYQSVTACYCPW